MTPRKRALFPVASPCTGIPPSHPDMRNQQSIMTAHGPDAQVFEAASVAKLEPVKCNSNGLAFMFETNKMLRTTTSAMQSKSLQLEYYKCWSDLKRHFSLPE